MTTPVLPAQRFRMGAIQLTIWNNKDRHGKPFYTTTITRSFRKEGQWTNTGSLRSSDLPAVRTLSEKALDWMLTQPASETPTPAPSPRLNVEDAIERIGTMIEQQLTR